MCYAPTYVASDPFKIDMDAWAKSQDEQIKKFMAGAAQAAATGGW